MKATAAVILRASQGQAGVSIPTQDVAPAALAEIDRKAAAAMGFSLKTSGGSLDSWVPGGKVSQGLLRAWQEDAGPTVMAASSCWMARFASQDLGEHLMVLEPFEDEALQHHGRLKTRSAIVEELSRRRQGNSLLISYLIIPQLRGQMTALCFNAGAAICEAVDPRQLITRMGLQEAQVGRVPHGPHLGKLTIACRQADQERLALALTWISALDQMG